VLVAGGGIMPWLGQTLVGTTDNDYEGDLERVAPSPDDVAYLLDALRKRADHAMRAHRSIHHAY
jgi:glycerol-3-phosphate dehydrogenase